jgi:nucleotide-binding universal stress UspA family protein
MKILLAVDGSQSAVRATRELVGMLAAWKDVPALDVVTVHLPVPHVGGFSGIVVSHEMIQRYYDEEGAKALAPCTEVLDAAGVKYSSQVLIGDIAQAIVDHARAAGCTLICIGSRGMTAVSNMVLGSVATKVLHLAHVPVLVVR